ncbi:MAG TPA: glutamate-1-semialdehyde 2,1-aminomutase [Longimicrobiales bacterium]|nr:glutamate-1-semialdehyde 2,1-aminomutase [Longimicrobiales bacterium]
MTDEREEGNGQSGRLFTRARQVIPGGVNSPARAFGAVGGEPFFADRAEGSRITDVDGHVRIDYVMSWGALMLGHAHPTVVHAVTEAAGRGTSYGVPSGREVELAELVVESLPSVDQVRFVNSGTEATMSAVRLARAYTSRDMILKFEGCYHGHADSFLVHAGSGVATLGLPDSPGVPTGLAELTLTAPFNDLESVRAVAERHGESLAAIIVEPIVGNAGFIPPKEGFLEGLRDVADALGSVLIFDEVMTGFRVGPAGAQGRFGVTPDLTTLGKVVGGGLPVGAFGGRAEIMEMVAPAGPVYQAGTLSGNPLAMAAGIAQLLYLRETRPWDALEQKARRLVDGIVDAARSAGIPAWGDAAGGMWGYHFAEGPVLDFEQARSADPRIFRHFFDHCLENGVYLPQSPYEAAFLSSEHSDADIDTTLDVVREAFAGVPA